MGDRPDLPLTGGDTVLQAAVGGIVINVLPAVALAGPEEAAILEECDRLGISDPSLGGIAKQAAGLRVRLRRRDLHKVQPGLGAILNIAVGTGTVGPPSDTADQERLSRVVRQVGPAHRAASRIDDPQPDLGVGLARAGILVLLNLTRTARVIEHGERAHVDVIEFQ